ncbi:dynein axonemal intermediate chain 4-like [Cylas formicarius]|uniref:dynein axonemal intermediate chain 4-like n=1 Tax=Cylas formicarius TaxID=197179 RepID=UPI002958DF05|nr:dynein axonemal intermediate chain 4-like [Cylas formicarius]
MTETRHTFQLTKKTLAPTAGKPKAALKSKAPVNVFHEGKDVTPKPLNPELLGLCKERQIGIFDEGSLSARESSSVAFVAASEAGTIKFRTEQLGETYQGSIFEASADFFEPSLVSQLTDTDQETLPVESDTELFDKIGLETEPDMKRAPTHVSLTLTETHTIFILDLPSCIAIKNSEEGDLVEEKNKQYEYLTQGKGRHRKVVNAEAQTVKVLKKSRKTAPEVVRKHNTAAFASNWEMYDTLLTVEDAEPNIYSSDDSDNDLVDYSKISESGSVESYRMSSDERQLYKLMKNSRFLEAVCVIERLLANNRFYEQQKRFSGLSEPDDLREDIQYKYRLNLLWTFSNSLTKGRCVSCMEWNPLNEDLLAVGYGKFYFAEQTTGMVMIWNMKNPVQPERTYKFENPVTALSFSSKDTNLLAVGFYDGRIFILNVTNREKQIIAENIPSFEVLWDVHWRPNPDKSTKREQIYASSDDGKVIVYTIETAKELQQQQIMRVAKADGVLKGYSSMRKCSNLNVPVSRYAGARLLRWHPIDPTIYLVATNEGVVHKCSVNYLDQHMDSFSAHEGPINDLQFSPFSKKIYATCGDDWYVRLWGEGIAEPLQELYVTMASVQDLDWSPTHSTILATIYDKSIVLWDFQRKFYKPQSECQSPTNSRNTIVQFTSSGRCLVVGDVDGNVHVFSLEDMPFPAFFQESLLFDVLQKSLVTKPNLMQKIKRMRKNLKLD